MNKNFTLLFFLLLPILLQAQQTPQSTLYNHNVYGFNTAVAGVEGLLSVNADLRRQWLGLEGAPSTQYLNAHLPVYITKGGFGLEVKNTTIGVTRNLRANLGYNQIINIGENTLFSFGVSGGIEQHTFNGQDLTTPDGIYEPGTFTHADAVLSEFNESAIAPIVSAGIYLKHKQLRFGLSADNLLASTFEFDNSRENIVFNQIRHYFGYISYEFELGNDLVLLPSVLLKAESAELQVDLNISAELQDMFILGVGYRGYNALSTDALVFQGGIRMNNNLQFIYSYDFGLSELVSTHTGSHEILIKYEIVTKIGKGVPPPIIYNPRFL